MAKRKTRLDKEVERLMRGMDFSLYQRSPMFNPIYGKRALKMVRKKYGKWQLI